ncbi:MAG: arginine--tRNA ligase, partial [Treponemataceae bacterium]|nr:arginine--tRNA ligase [Treponemataceae bacterium]
MTDAKSECRAVVAAALNGYMAEQGADGAVDAGEVVTENPPKPDMGDLGMPMFPFAKRLRAAPPVIAAAVVRMIAADAGLSARARAVGTFVAVGPYVNVRLDKAAAAAVVLSRIQDEGAAYGSLGTDGTAHCAGRRVMVEFSSPNTNKPLHLGHLRNDALGESVSRILKKAGAEVFKVNIINNRGVHICKSMLAYKLFHEANGDTPESLGMKGDHFVGQCYVEFDRYAKEHPEANAQAEEMLVQWERGADDDDLHRLWRMMNGWAIDGVRETYARTGVSFDRLYFESETYLKGREEILKGVERGIFFRAADGSVRVDVTEATGKGKDGENQEKVLLRKDGTSVYITQDIGTAIFRHEDWAFNQMVYVVASEQNYHFKVLFYLLRKLGFDWADRLFHLSYG